MAKRAAKKAADTKRVKVTLVKSTIGFDKQTGQRSSKAWVCAGSTTRLSSRDTPSIRGMIHKVRHLVTVE